MTESHHSSSSATPQLSAEEQELLIQFEEHQKNAPRISFAEEVRTLIDQSIGYGVLATNSIQFAGYPTGSVVGFSLDEHGLPFFVFSSMSAHTKDIMNDNKVSLTITSKDFKGASEGRVVLIGDISLPITDTDEKIKLREKYLTKHKDAYWIDFGDFSFHRMSSLLTVRFVGGFAMAGSVSPEDYISASPDPLANFATPVMNHMNEDHADSTADMVNHYIGIPVSDAKIVGLDRLGLTVSK